MEKRTKNVKKKSLHDRNTGVETMKRPDPKPFDPKQIKPASAYAKDAIKDAKLSAKTGKGKFNREEDLGYTSGSTRHTVTGSVPDKKK